MIIFILLFSCVIPPDKKQAKVYVSGLESLIDRDSEEVVSKIIDTWEFYCTKIWRKEDPAIKDVMDVVKDKTKFTKKEAKKIFSSQGQYKVMFFFKYLRDESVRLGTISSRGYSMSKDFSKTRKLVRHAYIRVVFKEGRLIHFRVWPSVEVWIS
jgi:hypothetical protein